MEGEQRVPVGLGLCNGADRLGEAKPTLGGLVEWPSGRVEREKQPLDSQDFSLQLTSCSRLSSRSWWATCYAQGQKSPGDNHPQESSSKGGREFVQRDSVTRMTCKSLSFPLVIRL